MPEVAEQQRDAQHQQAEQQDQQRQQEEQKQGRTFTQAEWDARQAEFDSKAAKIRRNAARETELRMRREADARQQGGQQQHAQQQEKDAEPPKREDFEDYESFLRAEAKYYGEKAADEHYKKKAQEESSRKAAESKAALQREFKKRANALIDETPDFAEVIESAEDVMITTAMADAIEEAEVGPRILYFLAKNPAEAERISKLSPTGQLREIGKIEARIEAELAAKQKDKDKDDDSEKDDGDGEQRQQEEQRSEERGGKEDAERDTDGRFKAQDKGTRKAPEPIEPGSGRSANQDRGPSDKDSDPAWYAKRLAQERAERARQSGKR